MKKFILLIMPLLAFASTTLISCGNDDDDEKMEKITFSKVSDIIGKQFTYTNVVDENLDYWYHAADYNAITFYANGTYERTQGVWTHKGTYTFANKTVTCTEPTSIVYNKKIIQYKFIDTNKEGYYFKVTEQRFKEDGTSDEPSTRYYEFYYLDVE